MGIVKRQHYVWRHYLQSWASNENIATYFTDSTKITRVGLMGVAQGRYFYKLIDFTDAEENFLKDFIKRTSPEAVKALNLDFLNLFTSTGKLKRALANSRDPLAREKYEEEIREMEMNFMEYGHGNIENLGMKLVSYRSLEELKTVEHDDYLFDAIMFLCFQYFRTKNMRKSVLKSFEDGPYLDLAKKSWNILSYVLATTLAKNISFDPKLKFIFHENHSTENFITGDQPIFNLLSDIVNESGEVTQLEFYYPLSPKHALTIHFRDDQTEKYVSKHAGQSQVDFFNKKVISNSDFYIFAETTDQLEKLKENGCL